MAAASPSTLFSVAGKNVLVTGGSRGIGLMIAKGFVHAGANVLLTSRSEDACREAAESLGGSPSCRYVASNVSSRAGCEQLAQHVAEIFDNRLDILINNAGTSWGEPLERTSGRANWGFDKVMDLVSIRHMDHTAIGRLLVISWYVYLILSFQERQRYLLSDPSMYSDAGTICHH